MLRGFHDAGERAVDGVVAEQVREHLGTGEVVDRRPLDPGAALVRGAERGAAGAAEAVDRHTSWHEGLLVDSALASPRPRQRASEDLRTDAVLAQSVVQRRLQVGRL